MKMDNYPFVIIGCGGHAKVVAAALRDCNKKIYTIFDDDDTKVGNLSFANISIQKTPQINWWHDNLVNTIIAVGSNSSRQKITNKLSGIRWGQVIHPTAVVHESSTIGNGTYVGANAVIQPGAHIGNHSIINTGAIIEHDAVIGDYCHIAPGSIVTGHVRIGIGTLIGAGTIIIPEITIGNWSTIGAGSVVVRNIANFQKAYGNPCREVIETSPHSL